MLIPSFAVDHTKIIPGIFESRVDKVGTEYVTTYDIRMKRPNIESAISPEAMHTIEHVIATYLRNDFKWADRLIYWGPMGCLTGFYMVVKGRYETWELYPVIVSAFDDLAKYSKSIPGRSLENCGNYKLHDLQAAKQEAYAFVKYLLEAKGDEIFYYPKTERLELDDGTMFFDS